MLKFRYLITIFILLIIVSILLLIAGKYSSEAKELIISNSNLMNSYINQYYYLSFFITTLLFVAIISLMGPVGPFVILIGYFFSLIDALLISFISQLFGAIIIYFYSSYIFKTYLNSTYFNKFKYLKEKFEKNSISFLILLRVVGGIPFSIQTIIVSIFRMKFQKFFIATAIGTIPHIIILSSIGNNINSLLNSSSLRFNILLNKEYWIPLLLIIVLVIINIIFREKKSNS